MLLNEFFIVASSTRWHLKIIGQINQQFKPNWFKMLTILHNNKSEWGTCDKPLVYVRNRFIIFKCIFQKHFISFNQKVAWTFKLICFEWKTKQKCYFTEY